ncbi:hypothetical protein FPV23_03855 [Carnobacterium sp. PL17RED31]|nr:hypothetical protein FPV23_03855 [Carnobacterium sp. PL17RED31]
MTDFTYNGQPLNKAYEVVVDNIINDSFFVTFNHPLDDKGIYKIIEKDKIVKVHTPDGMQPFRIMDRVKYMDHVSIEAWPLFYADMRNKLVKPLTIRGLSGQAAVNTFVNNLLIETPFTFTSNITDTHDYHTQDTEERENNPDQLYNALDIFKDIVARWQGELVINGYDVRVVNRLGKNTGALLYEKKNISDFTDEESIQDVTTRLYGKSEWTERPEGSDQEIKHKISVKVESPLINAYSGIVFEKQYTNNDIRTEKEMTDWLNLKFTTDNIDKPSRNIKVGTNIVDDTVINLGDSLVLKYVKHDVDMEIRMVGYTYDGYTNRYITIQLGDAKQSYVGNVQNTVREIETNVNNNVKQTVNQILNANGERMIYSVTEPVGNFKNGDVWFDQQGGMYFWDEESGMWIDHPYNRNMHVMEDEVNAAIETAESAKALAVSEAEQALINANKYADDQDALITQQVNTSVSTAISTAEEAKQAAETSYTNAVAEAERLTGEQSTAFNKKFEENTLVMNTLSQATQDADTKAKAALDKAGANANLLTTHQTTLDTIKNTTIPNVNKVATDAMAEAQSALSSASSAMDEAKKADGKIADYVTKNGLVSGTTVDTKINSATGEINKKITTVEGKIDGLQVGGRNLFSKSNITKDIDSTKEFSLSGWASEFMNNQNVLRILEEGKIYTLSYDVELTKRTNIPNIYSYQAGLYLYSPSTPNDVGFYVNMRELNDKARVEVTFVCPPLTDQRFLYYTNRYTSGGSDPIGFDTIKITNLKLEKGNIATDWTAAEEDNLSQSEFSIFESTYDETVKGINSTLTDLSTKKLDGTTYTNFYNNEYKQTAQGVTDAWTAVNKIVDANGNSTDTFAKAVYDKNAIRQAADFKLVTDGLVKTTTYTAGINGVKNSITSIQGDIKYLSKNINYFSVAKWESVTNKPTTTSVPYITIDGLKPNTTYTVSTNIPARDDAYYDVFADTDFDISPASSNANGISNKRPRQVLSNANGQIDVAMRDYNLSSGEWWIKVEEGEVATPWNPNINDLLGKTDFQIFKNDYERNDKIIQSRLTAIDSSAEGSVVTRLNATEKTANGNTTTISNIKTKPHEQIIGYQTIKSRSDLYERVIGSSSEAGVKQAISRVVMTDSTFQTEVIDRQNLLAAMASGTGMTKDPYFEKGNNDIGVYDNGRTGTITIRHTAIPSNTSIPAPKGSTGYRLDITHEASTATTPNRGGIVCNANSWANGTVVIKFVALLPIGRSFAQANNPLGTGFTVGWLTDNKGTGKWETYMYYYRFGSTGAFSTFGHLSVTGASTAFTWYLSEYDIINVNETTASKITQLADNINLKVSKADLISEINVSTEGVRIAGKNIQLDGNVYMTSYFQVPNANIKDLAVDKITGTNAQFTTMITKGLTADVITSTMIKADTALFNMLFSTTSATDRLAARDAWIKSANISTLDASKITSGTIDAARLNAGAIVTAGLTANVVKSGHIEAGTALVDKIFSTSAYITQLTSKTAFVSSIQAISISATKITSGTLDASKITVTNLDGNSITANQANLIKVGLTSSSGGTLALNGDQLLSTASDNSQVYLQNGIVGMRNPTGASIGQIGYRYAGGSPQMNLFTTEGSHFSLVQRIAGNDVQTIYITNGGKEYHNSAVNSWFNSLTNTFSGEIKIMNTKNLSMSGGNITNPYQISLQYGGKLWSVSNNSDFNISSSTRLWFHSNGSVAFYTDSGYMYLERHLSMQGHNITNQSDRRLKTNIVDTPVDSLSAISNWVFKAFDRVNNDSHDDVGLIAQDTSEIVVYDEENDIYNINSSKQIMMNSHGIQQLNIKVDDEISQLKAQVTNLQEELALLKGDRK